MSTVPKPRFTPEEYLARERKAAYKSEYDQGEIFDMSGASIAHNTIELNLTSELRARVRGGPCRVFPGNLRVKASPSGLYTYPDASIVCGQMEFDDRELDTLRNPRVLFEVLSESTEAYDRGTKSQQYRRIDALWELVLIAQSEAHVECYTRVPEAGWRLTEAEGLDNSLLLSSINVTLPLAEIYRGVEFRARDLALNPPPPDKSGTG